MHRLCALVLAAALAVGLTACTAPRAGAPGAVTTDESCPQATAPLASLALVDDVRTARGPSTACLARHEITPVEDDTAPALPVTVTGSEDREVEITTVDRILPIDISGTIASTIFALGLGDRVVGRDSSTLFPGTEHLPVVTKTGHSLNPEAILELAPTVILTDTSIGPKEVRQQLRDAGIAVVVISSERRLDTTGALVTEIASALGVPSRGQELRARLHDDVQTAVSEIAAVAPRPSRTARGCSSCTCAAAPTSTTSSGRTPARTR